MGLSQVQKQVSGLKNFVGMSVGKIGPWKKSLLFEWCLMLIQKYISLLAGKILLNANDFLPSKVKYIFCFNARCCSNPQIFFPLGNPPYAKKVKESLYFDQLPGPFKSATLFFIICLLNKRKGRDNMMEMSFYLFLLLIFLVIQLFVTDKQKC